MTRRVSTRASADADLASQMAWYLENATPELAERFLGAVQETAETLLEFPSMGFRHGFRQPALTDYPRARACRRGRHRRGAAPKAIEVGRLRATALARRRCAGRLDGEHVALGVSLRRLAGGECQCAGRKDLIPAIIAKEDPPAVGVSTVSSATAATKAEYLVTGDRKHLLSLGTYQGIQIVTPWVDLSTQREEVKDYLIENCRRRKRPRGWCIVAITERSRHTPTGEGSGDHPRPRPPRAQAMKADPHWEH